MLPRVSVIMPVYNGGPYVMSALATMAAQSVTEWQLIVVDDGSTDDTAWLLRQAPSDPRRQVLHQTNLGRSAARNRGLKVAQAEIVAFLDVDDGWSPAYLAQMCSALDRAPQAVAAFCGWQYMDEAGQRRPQAVLLSQKDLDRFDQELFWRNSIPSSSLVARRQTLLDVAGFDETLHACEDWDLWLRLRAHGTFVPVSRVLTSYRARLDSTTEDVALMERDRLKVNAKHLGSLAEPQVDWPGRLRQAVGFTYFNAALGYFWQKDRTLGRKKVEQAVQSWPGLLEQDEFYYELGCAFQPRGVRGTTMGLDLGASAALIRDILFSDVPAADARSARAHWGRACLVLARLARDIHDTRASRTFARKALRHATGRDQLRAIGLLVRSVVPQGWAQAFSWLRTGASVSRPS